MLITPMLAIAFVYSTWVISDDMETTWQGEPFFEFVNTRSRQATAQQEIVVTPAGRLLEDAVSSQPNIIFVHADALRADRLGAYGNPRNTSPFLDGLIARGAQKIPFGFSNCSESMCGFSSVLTSSFSFHSARTGLFEILSDRGYVVSFIGTGSMYESNIGEYIRPRVDNFLRADLDDNYYMHDDRYVLDILTNYPEYAGVPNFFYLRMMSPHNLSRNLEKYRKYHPTRDSLLFMLGGKSLRQTAINDHDNRVVQFDAYLQEIYASLDKKGYLDNAIVVIYGDHGDAMDERGTYGHYQTLYQEEIHVPIVFWSSENVGLDVNTDFFATLMDIPPTVLTQLDQPVPDFFLGSPLQLKKTEKLGYLDSRKDTVGLVYQDKQQLLKLIMDRDDRALVELYDLRNDPGEQANLFRSKPEVAKRMVDERLSIMVRAGNSD